MINNEWKSLNLPDKFNKQELSEIASKKYSDFAKKIDKHDLLKGYEFSALSTIFGTLDIITNSENIPIHMIQHEPMTAYRHDRSFKIGDVFALQNDISYVGLQAETPLRLFEAKDDIGKIIHKSLSNQLKKRNLTFEDLCNATNEKTLYLYPRVDSEIKYKAIKYVEDICQQGALPVHFSLKRFNDNFFEGDLLNLRGLHLHLYSNHLLEEGVKSKWPYNTVVNILRLPPVEKQKAMLKTRVLYLPAADLKFLKDPRDEYNTLLAYYIR